MSDTLPRRPAALWMDAWIDLGLGLLVLALCPRMLQWASSRLLHTHFDEFIDNGTGIVVPYTKVHAFWIDLGPTLFGIVLVISGILHFTGRRSAILLALALTAASVVYNAGYLATNFQTDGVQFVSLAAVVVGVYMMLHQWQAISGPRAVSAG